MRKIRELKFVRFRTFPGTEPDRMGMTLIG